MEPPNIYQIAKEAFKHQQKYGTNESVALRAVFTRYNLSAEHKRQVVSSFVSYRIRFLIEYLEEELGLTPKSSS